MKLDIVERIKENIKQVFVGNEKVIELLLTALFAGGHILIDDVPGMGKTKLANALARSLGCQFKRIQFTPDLQPADVTGIYYYNQKEGEFSFRAGPVMTNILLADEINRAVPRTQSSLLEVMEERQLTVEGRQFKLEEPFMVVATQNPVEMEGTFPLPEAQLDRFLLWTDLGYPTEEEELEIMGRYKSEDPLQSLEPVVGGEEILIIQREIGGVRVSTDLMTYIRRLAVASRQNPEVRLGLSPRGSLALLRAGMAYAYLQGRDYLLPDDLQYLFPHIIRHRLILSAESEFSGISKDELIREIMEGVEVPVEGVHNE